jgi:hypothetical protein
MNQLEPSLTPSLQSTLSQINSVLLPKKSSSSYRKEFEHQITKFKTKLFTQWEKQLSFTIENLMTSRKTKNMTGPLSFEEKQLLVETTQDEFTNILKLQLSTYKEKTLPTFLKKASRIWKGLEDKLSKKMKKMKEFVSKHRLQSGAIA